MNAPELSGKSEAEADQLGIDRGDLQNKLDSVKNHMSEYKAKARELETTLPKAFRKEGYTGFVVY